ncbi:MAG: oligosaccharide flippase family protein [Ignavibacteria bacterium]|nr:oligosaccharide flippase family protein [Ignavibacteria bacterium]
MFEKIKALSKDTLIYGTNTIIGRFINFLFVPLYTNIFAPSEFGIVANIYAYIAILNVFFTIGLESGFFRFAATLEVGDSKENFSHPFLGILINSFILSCILFIFSKNLSWLFQVPENRSIILKYTALILFFDAIAIVPFAYLRLARKPVKFVTIKLINIGINVTLNFILILGFRWGIESVFISNVIASVITFILLTPIVIKNLTLKFNKELFSELLKFSLPYIPAGISSNIIQVISRPMLYLITKDYSEVGIFQANYKLGIFMMLFVSMFEFAWRPFFMQTFQEPDAKKVFSKVLTLFTLAEAFLFVLLTLFINDIVHIKFFNKGYLIGQAYWSGLNIVPIVLFAYLVYGIYINLMPGIYIMKKTKYLSLITGVAALVNVILNLILIPFFGIFGSAIASLFSYISMAVGIFLVVNKYYKIHYEYSKLMNIFIAIFITTSLYYYINTLNTNVIIYLKFVLLFIFISLIFILKVVRIDNVRFVMQKLFKK